MYGIDGVEPDFSGIEKALWLQFKFVLDETASRRIQNIENGKKGGRPAKSASKEKPVTENWKRQRSVFPSGQALLKALYLATFEATKNGLSRFTTGGSPTDKCA